MSILNPPGPWGFTNDRAYLEAVQAYRDAAIADGWTVEPTYAAEEIGRACRLKKSDFVMMVLTRENRPGGKFAYEVRAYLWGPDGLAIKPQAPHNWDQIKEGLRVCGWCGATGVHTERVGFANRVCAKCAPEARKKIEVPGWCD